MRTGWVLAALVAAGCAPSYRGSARPFATEAFRSDPGWVAVPGVPELRQRRELDCGPTATAMVLGFWGEPTDPDDLRAASGTPVTGGVQAGTLRDLLRAHGLTAYLVEGNLADIERELAAGRPVVVGLAKPYTNGIYAHYEVVAGINRARGMVATLDPGSGWTEDSIAGFLREWRPTHNLMLVVSPPPAQPEGAGAGGGPTALTLHLGSRAPRTTGLAHAPP